MPVVARADAAPDPGPAVQARRHWERPYVFLILGLDAAVAAVTAIGLAVAGVAPFLGAADDRGALLANSGFVLGWAALLAASGAYDTKVLALDAEEYRRVLRSAVRVVGALAAVAVFARVSLAPLWIAAVSAGSTVLALWGRHIARRVLHRRWATGRDTRRVLAIGDITQVRRLVDAFDSTHLGGFRVVAALTPRGRGELVGPEGRIPVAGTPTDIAAALARWDADTVAIADTSTLGVDALQDLAWQLRGTGVDLVVLPDLTELAWPRVSARPVNGLPLVFLDEPQLSVGAQMSKHVVDRIGAVVLLVLCAPVLLALAAAVRMDSRGPSFYKQTRVGQDGRLFTMLKLRTMVTDADRRLTGLRHRNESGGEFFKLRADPRVTRVGRWLRRHSLDELPQLVNVLRGEMSLVGPRPPLPGNAAARDLRAVRRLHVKPGMTGLWQVSGRADLSWEETLRLDLHYVERWSPALDVQILWRTIPAVVRGNGAY